MRPRRTHLIAGALLLVALLLSFLFILSAPQKKQLPQATDEFSAQLKECHVANAEGAYALYCALLLSAQEPANLTLYFFQSPPKRAVYFLEGPHVEITGYEALKKLMQKNLAQLGIPFMVVSADGAAALRNSILIIPSGIFPCAVYERLPSLLLGGNVLIYSGMPPSYLLEQDGSISQNQNKSLFELPQRTQGWETLRVNASYFYYNSKSPDKLGGAIAFATQMRDAIISQPWLATEGSGAFISNHTGAKTLFVLSKFPQGYPRIHFETAGREGIIDVQKASKFSGSILHPASVSSSRELELQMLVNKSFSSSVLLSLSLLALRDGEVRHEQGIGSVNVSRLWFRSISLGAELAPGSYVLLLRDQYGQTHAASYLRVKEINVRQGESLEGTYSFFVEEDGKPLTDAFAEVQIDNKSAGRHPIVGGLLRISPEIDSSSPHSFSFEINRKRVSLYSPPSPGIFSFYAAYGVPALLLMIAVYLVFRRKRIPLSLIFPDVKKGGACMVRMKKERVLQALKVAQGRFKAFLGLTVSDIRRELERSLKEEGKDMLLLDENVLEVLNSLKEKGFISNHRDYYMPKCENARKAALLRQAYEKLVAGGRKFSFGKEGAIKCGKDTIIVFDEGNLPKLPKEGRLILVFENDDEIESFRKSLFEYEKEKLKFSLALRTKKLILSTPEGLEKLL